MGLVNWYKKRRVQRAEQVMLRQRELANPHVGLLKYIYNKRRLKNAEKVLLQHSEAQKLGSPKAEMGMLERLREWRVQRAEQARIRRGEVVHEAVSAGRLLPAKGGNSASMMEWEARVKKVMLMEEEAVLAKRRTEEEDKRIRAEQDKMFKKKAEEKMIKLREEAEQLRRRKQEELDIQERQRKERENAEQAKKAARRAMERGEAQRYAHQHGWR